MPKRICAAAFSVFLGFLCGGEAFSLPLESLLSEAQIKQLLQSGAIDRENVDSSNIGMTPHFENLEQLITINRQSVDPNITSESLRLYKKPSDRNWTVSERADLFNGIIAVSTLKGLEYYSKRRNSMRLLYEISTVIDGPESKNPRADPVFRTPPAEVSIFVRQKDLTFGDNIYKYTYYAYESAFIVLMENITSLSYGPVQVVGKNRLKSVIAIFDCGPHLLVYSASFAKASIVPGMKQRVGESISNRTNALLSWFTKKADKAFGKS